MAHVPPKKTAAAAPSKAVAAGKVAPKASGSNPTAKLAPVPPVKAKTVEKAHPASAAAKAPPAKEPAPEKVVVERPAYGVPQLAEVLGTKPASVRVRLRNAGIEKDGKTYGWKTRTEMLAVAKQLKSKKAEETAEETEEVEEEAEETTDDEGEAQEEE